MGSVPSRAPRKLGEEHFVERCRFQGPDGECELVKIDGTTTVYFGPVAAEQYPASDREALEREYECSLQWLVLGVEVERLYGRVLRPAVWGTERLLRLIERLPGPRA